MSGSMFNLPLRSARFFLFGSIILLFLFCGSSGQPAIGDECRVAGIAMEMAQEGDWLLPRLNGAVFLEYPPLYYWCVAPFLKLFGGTPWSVHAASLLIGALMGVAMFGFARTVGLMPGAALFAAMLLLTNNTFLGASILCRVDILLAFFALIGWWGGALCWIATKPRRRLGFWMLTAGLAGAFLTKNLAGGIILVCGPGMYLILTDVLEKRFRFRRYLLLGGAFFTALVPYLLYLWCLDAHFGRKAVEDMAIYNNFGRFSGSRGEHSKPVWYYFKVLPEQFQPWLILLLAAVVHGVRRAKNLSQRWLYPAVLMAVPFVLLSLSSGKRQVYLLPLAAPAALFTGIWLDACLRRRGELIRRRRQKKILLFAWSILLGAVSAGAVGFAVAARVCGVGSLRFELGAAGVVAFGIWLFLRGRKRKWTFRIPGEQLGWTWVFFAFSFGVMLGSFRAIQLREDTYDCVFQMLAQRNQGQAVYLYQPPERLSGAAYYYRKVRTPVFAGDPKTAEKIPAGAFVLMNRQQTAAFPQSLWESVPVPKWTKLGILVRRDGNGSVEAAHLTQAGSSK